MEISELMTSKPVFIMETDLISNAKKILIDNTIKHLPVMNKHGQVTGILSDRDIKLHQAVSDDPNFHATARVADAQRQRPYVVSPDTPARQVLQEMHERRIGSAIIVDDDRLVGIFTSVDACRILAGLI